MGLKKLFLFLKKKKRKKVSIVSFIIYVDIIYVSIYLYIYLYCFLCFQCVFNETCTSQIAIKYLAKNVVIEKISMTTCTTDGGSQSL